MPEIHSGTVEIRAIAREAGSRSKVAVASRQEGLDPVGATVGQRGARVQAVVAELGGEKIDVIPWNDDAGVFVANALSPAQVISVDIDEEHRIASVTVPERMLSLAIGREGQNARLAARLTGWRIDIRSDVSVAEAKAAAAEAAKAPPEGGSEAPAAAAELGAPAAGAAELDGASPATRKPAAKPRARKTAGAAEGAEPAESVATGVAAGMTASEKTPRAKKAEAVEPVAAAASAATRKTAATKKAGATGATKTAASTGKATATAAAAKAAGATTTKTRTTKKVAKGADGEASS